MDEGMRDRAAGVLLGQACGDALGAGYEFGPALPGSAAVVMKGGGGFGWAPGEWTDDTQMAIPLLEAAEMDGGLMGNLDHVARRWVDWAVSAADVGNQTRQVLGACRRSGDLTAESLVRASHAQHAVTGHTAGNGSLMRTGIVAVAYLDDVSGLASVARHVSSLTHWDDDAGDACVLWCLAIRHAVLTGSLDIAVGLEALPAARRDVWSERMAEAAHSRPVDFPRNGWVVHAFQAAWSAIATTRVPDLRPEVHLQLALENAVRAGGDTDTVAAIAGQLLGARWGASSVPDQWMDVVHGWPHLRAGDLAARGAALAG